MWALIVLGTSSQRSLPRVYCSSQAFVSNLIDLGYWKVDKVTHKHFRGISYLTTELDMQLSCKAQ